jgi:hypothetical protein
MTPRDGPQPPGTAPGALPATPPEAALEAIRAFDGPLLVDLDQTLYLRDSTEDFIDSARPAVMALALMKLLDWIRPWRRTGGAATRDAWRVRSVLLLMPWTARRWRQRIPRLVEQFGNHPLIAALRVHASRPFIVTRGFRPIVTPLVAAFALGEAGIVAPRPEDFGECLRGKLPRAVDALGEDAVRRALAITDSTDDLPLLEACAQPLHTVWPEARHRAALPDVYLPGHYLSRATHPGGHTAVRGILQEDFALWLLASIALAAQPVAHVAGLLFLLLSFWAIHERGHVDRDRIDGAAGHATPVPTPRWDPWVWALVSGAIAILLLRGPARATAMDFAVWTGVLLASHGWFLLHNRFDRSTRAWLYPGLQFARSAAFVALAPVAAIGAAALAAHILAQGEEQPAEARRPLSRLLFFIVLASLLALTQGVALLLTWTAAALLAWNLWLARAELKAVVLQARRIDRPQAGPP